MEAFLNQFRFSPELRGHLGVEREFFLHGPDGRPVPESPQFLTTAADPTWTYELSACQVEHRTPPCADLRALQEAIRAGQRRGEVVARGMDRTLAVREVGPIDMPLDVYPHDPRYATITATLPIEVLRAACQVTGTHVHIGTASLTEAIEVHNRLVPRLDEFLAIGDHSNGERRRLYTTMAKNWSPPVYESVDHFSAVATEQGFAANPRDCWHFIRISRYGTVEVRAFGMTPNIEETVEWARRVHQYAALT